MIHELREYTFKRPKWEAYWDLFNQVCMPIRKSNFGTLACTWKVERGDQVRFLHLWEYDSLEVRRQQRGALAKNKAWSDEFLPQATALIETQVSRILSPVMPVAASDDVHEVYLTASYCRVGNAADVAAGIAARRDDMLGVWMEEFCDPNRVLSLSAQPLQDDRTAGGKDAIRYRETQWLERLPIQRR
ncbi:NIPSNAP family protein [Halomonas sp. V046]|uniref:NIPSNAP family protein n=1 Tax=Halomonas sp. V046 TaxID=3459611 RepID=UPI004044782F